MLNLFHGKRLSEVSFEMLRKELAEQEVAEGFFVDYKIDFPERLWKTISSFANSYGGHVFIGIEEDEIKKTPKAFPGVPITCDLTEKVRNIIRSHISPMPSVEIATIPLTADDQLGIVAIRISESGEPPHVCSDGRVYKRNLDASDPADPIRDRHSLDNLYLKADRLQQKAVARLGNTLTHRKLIHEKDWNKPSEEVVGSLLIYPKHSAGSEGYNVLSEDELNQMLHACPHGGNFRKVQGGKSLVWTSERKDMAHAMWWRGLIICVAYEDGILEYLLRQKPQDRTLNARLFAEEFADVSVKHGAFLRNRMGYIGPIVLEISMHGMYGRRFTGKSSTPTYACDSGVVRFQFSLQDGVTSGCLADEFTDAMIGAAGGFDSLAG